jgi:hypothetical protein
MRVTAGVWAGAREGGVRIMRGITRCVFDGGLRERLTK